MTRTSDNHLTFKAAAGAWEEGMAAIARLYGLSPLATRLYAVLFLATEPRSLDELCGATGAAKSSVSVALRGLSRARVVRRLPPRADRKDYYEAITDPWQIVADWNRIYFQPEIAIFRENGDALESALDHASDAPTGEAANELRRRIAAMRELYGMFEDLFGQLDRRRSTPRATRSIAIKLEDEP